MRLSLGLASTLPSDYARVVHVPGGAPPKTSVIVIQTSIGVRAYWNVCQHVPAPLDDGSGVLGIEGALVCRSHGARYSLEDGLCFSGPCRGKFLEQVAVIREGDALFADL